MPVDYSNTTSSLKKWIDVVASRIKRQLLVDRTNASRRTYNSIETRVDGLKAEIGAEQANGADVSTLELIDKGRRRGGMPPVRVIEKWMEDKNIRPKSGGRFSDKSRKSSAFAIAKAIAEKGTIKRFAYKGSDVIDFATQPIIDNMTEEILTSYASDVERYLKNRGK